MTTPTGDEHARHGPARVADEQIGLNGAIAAALTRRVGSMWTVYATLAIVSTWIALAVFGPLQTVDGYPFSFLLFLGNVAQLLLCLVILVGQRVLGRAADRRAEQTYEHAEAIFWEVARLQEHLNQQDRALSRGMTPLHDSLPHAWIARHGVEEPPRAIHQAATLNGLLAAWITERLGSMWAVYAAVVFQALWMGLAIARVLYDPYPFPFLLFLSSLAQLVFMLVIMVGQDVTGRAADQRSRQTFNNAEAILFECRRMEEHLAEQDHVIASINVYALRITTEELARAIHRAYLNDRLRKGERPGGRPTLVPWDDLAEDVRESNRDQARAIGRMLAGINCALTHQSAPALTFDYKEDEVLRLARVEHERWVNERTARGQIHGPDREPGTHPDLVAWEELAPDARHKNEQMIRELPQLLEEAGFRVVRLREEPSAPAV
jgi:uncharacterized membrane protein